MAKIFRLTHKQKRKMKFKQGDKVQLTKKAIEEWKKTGSWNYVFNGKHTVSHYSGDTLYTTENLGIHNENDLELIESVQKKEGK